MGVGLVTGLYEPLLTWGTDAGMEVKELEWSVEERNTEWK